MPKHSVAAAAGAYGGYAGGMIGGAMQAALGGLSPYGMPYGAGATAAAAAAANVQQPAKAAAGHDRPRFLPGGGVALLLCDVALGRPGTVTAGSRRPEAGYHSAAMSTIHAVYQNDQASGIAAWPAAGSNTSTRASVCLC